ncbi:MAG TPA: DUF3971 domain-containing protein, partial [Beijerinckiaceae bacterium]|nr:DUF3971 domain-containing protein [Beijerinckiaceae bacterium]
MRLIAAGLALVLVLAVLAFAGLFLRLKQGPLTIAWLGPQLQQALMQRLGPAYRVRVGAPAVEAGKHGPALALSGLALASASGETILNAPKAKVTLDPLALLFGAVRPTSVQVYGVELRLIMLPDGSVAISAGAKPIVLSHLFAASSPPPSARPAGGGISPAATLSRAGVMKQAGAALRSALDLVTAPDSPLAAVQRVGIAQGTLVVEDRAANRTIVFKDMQLSFTKESNGRRLTLAADGPSGRWTLTASATGAPGTPRALDIDAQDLSIDEISLVGGLTHPGFDLDTPISARLHFALAPDGSFADASGRVALGSGFFHVDNPDAEPQQIDALVGHFHWDSASKSFILDPILFNAPGEMHFQFDGSVVPPRSAGKSWLVKLATSGPAAFGVERPHEKPIQIAKLSLAARVSPSERRIVLDRFVAQGPQLDFSMRGAFGGLGSGPKVVVSATAGETHLRDALRLWPSFIAAPARSWLLDHVEGGQLVKGSLALSLSDADLVALKAHHAPAAGDAEIEFSIEHGAVSFIPGVPALTDLVGTGRVTGRTILVKATHGTLDAGDNRLVAL